MATFSGLLNLLALTGSLYMLQVYDRVIPSHSVPTLIGLTVFMLLMYAAFGLLDVLRARVASRIGRRLDRCLRGEVFSAALVQPLRLSKLDQGLLCLKDLDQVRIFLSGPAPIALFDLPWMPFYLLLVFLLHPWLGWLGLAGSIVLIALTALTELLSRNSTRSSTTSATERQNFAGAARRNAEVIHALGMRLWAVRHFDTLSETNLCHQIAASDVGATFGNISKTLRYVLQSGVLGLGAYLVLAGAATPGVMIAASILVSRALAPVEVVIANWRSFLSARQSMERLEILLISPTRQYGLKLPPPTGKLEVESLTIAAPNQSWMLLEGVSFSLRSGDGLGIIGPSASGKSSLARALVGVWTPHRGSVRLDGATLGQWNGDELGRHIGYLPQDIELFDATIAENIARFESDASLENIIHAAQSAGVHQMILRLSDGYNTRIGEGGILLSAGQRQRIGLARALYREPFLVVLDEPNSNLDAEGEESLRSAIRGIRDRGGIAIVIAHRPSALANVDHLLALSHGRCQAIGPKEEVLRRCTVSNGAVPIGAGSRPRIVEGTAS